MLSAKADLTLMRRTDGRDILEDHRRSRLRLEPARRAPGTSLAILSSRQTVGSGIAWRDLGINIGKWPSPQAFNVLAT